MGIVRGIAILAVACGCLCGGCATRSRTDAQMSRRLLGTWVGEATSEVTVRTEVTYFADHTGLEVMRAPGQPKAAEITVRNRWGITNGILTLRTFETTRPDVVPLGLELQDRLAFATPDKLILYPQTGYPTNTPAQAIRIRKSGMP